MFKELEIPAVYTLEASLCGAEQGPLKDKHFTTKNLMKIGKDVFRALLLYCDIKLPVKKIKKRIEITRTKCV